MCMFPSGLVILRDYFVRRTMPIPPPLFSLNDMHDLFYGFLVSDLKAFLGH
jgi:hypothetical protein